MTGAGRRVFGAAALAAGLITLVWHDYQDFDQLRSILNASDGPVIVDILAVVQIFGGVAMQFRRSAQTGAGVLGAAYLILGLLFAPKIVASPLTYDPWGNFFEQFSLAAGAAIVYAHFAGAWAPETLARTGRILVGICVASFALEQAFYLDATAALVPKWIPPSPTFWAVATTVAFALAAISLLADRRSLLAARLLTIMLVLFGLIVWVPVVLSAPHDHTNWSETIETFGIAGVAWILADLLGENARTSCVG